MKKRLINIKSIDEQAKTITAYVSTYQWDRMEERFVKGCWDLGAYKANPVGLWAHNEMGTALTAGRPIMKSVQIGEDDHGVLSVSQFDDQFPFAMDVFSQYERGFLNTFSVGFRPKPNGYKVEPVEGTNRKGLVWTDVELLEYSAVPIPANPGAKVERSFAEDLIKICGDGVLVKSADSEDLVISPEFGKQFLEKEDAAPAPDLSESLKSLIDLAKIAKNQKLDSQRLELVKASMTVLQELILDNEGGVPLKDFNEIKGMVGELAVILKNNQPDVKDLVSKFMMQFEAALRGGRTN